MTLILALALVLAVVISPLAASTSLPPPSGSASTSGVPCYLRPARDACHYRLRPGSDSCTTPQEKKKLNDRILLVNRTLMSLEQQLIRLGISKEFDVAVALSL